jgi:hypothetical protein
MLAKHLRCCAIDIKNCPLPHDGSIKVLDLSEADIGNLFRISEQSDSGVNTSPVVLILVSVLIVTSGGYDCIIILPEGTVILMFVIIE